MRKKFTNSRVISHTMPVYEYRDQTWYERWTERRRSEKNTDELLGYKDYTVHIIILAALAIILGTIVAGVLVVG